MKKIKNTLGTNLKQKIKIGNYLELPSFNKEKGFVSLYEVIDINKDKVKLKYINKNGFNQYCEINLKDLKDIKSIENSITNIYKLVIDNGNIKYNGLLFNSKKEINDFIKTNNISKKNIEIKEIPRKKEYLKETIINEIIKMNDESIINEIDKNSSYKILINEYFNENYDENFFKIKNLEGFLGIQNKLEENKECSIEYIDDNKKYKTNINLLKDLKISSFEFKKGKMLDKVGFLVESGEIKRFILFENIIKFTQGDLNIIIKK